MCQNDGQKPIFCFVKIVAWPKFEKHFPTDFSPKSWLKVGEDEYIYIFEIKFQKIYYLKMAAKTGFVTLRNNVNLCLLEWKWRNRYYFFFTKRYVTDI